MILKTYGYNSAHQTTKDMKYPGPCVWKLPIRVNNSNLKCLSAQITIIVQQQQKYYYQIIISMQDLLSAPGK